MYANPITLSPDLLKFTRRDVTVIAFSTLLGAVAYMLGAHWALAIAAALAGGLLYDKLIPPMETRLVVTGASEGMAPRENPEVKAGGISTKEFSVMAIALQRTGHWAVVVAPLGAPGDLVASVHVSPIPEMGGADHNALNRAVAARLQSRVIDAYEEALKQGKPTLRLDLERTRDRVIREMRAEGTLPRGPGEAGEDADSVPV